MVALAEKEEVSMKLERFEISTTALVLLCAVVILAFL
jgi:hypothetical protein